jgi:hypothetical protein
MPMIAEHTMIARAERRIAMSSDTIEHWEYTQAELEIRRWLYKIGLWAPGAERYGWQSPDETAVPRPLTEEQIDQVLRSEVVGRIRSQPTPDWERQSAERSSKGS